VEHDPETIELELDQDASPVARQPRRWFVCFVPAPLARAPRLDRALQMIEASEEYEPGAPRRRPGAPKPFCLNGGRDLAPEWDRPGPHAREIPA
jgi:hypothetical protein